MNRQLLLVVACVVCLLAVATALPSADPRIDTSGDGDWDTLRGSGEDTNPTGPDATNGTDNGDGGTDDTGDNSTTDRATNGTQSDDDSAAVNIRGSLAPGNNITVQILGSADSDGPLDTPVYVDDERVGTGAGTVLVPFREQITVSAPEENVTERFSVATNASIRTDEPRVPGRTTNVTVTVDSMEIPGATVRVGGTAVATTDENGTATVPLPAGGESATISVERGAVSGSVTVPLSEIDVEFESTLDGVDVVLSPMLPGLPATVEVSAGGEPVESATVTVDGETAQTDGSGEAKLWLPVSNEATAEATAGAATDSATVSGLYLRLTVVVVVVPSILLGIAVAGLRVAAMLGLPGLDRRQGGGIGTTFYALGGALVWLTGLFTLSGISRSGRRSWPSWPSWSVSLPSLPSLPDLSGLRFPRFSGGLPAVGAVGDLLPGGSGESTTTAGTGTDESADATGGDTTGTTDQTPDEQISHRWHEFVAALGIERPETWTPGQVTRRALAAGYPATQVRSLVTTFRAIEYGGRAATQDRVERVRETCRSLLDHDPDSEGDT